jgi:hypothetical protein
MDIALKRRLTYVKPIPKDFRVGWRFRVETTLNSLIPLHDWTRQLGLQEVENPVISRKWAHEGDKVVCQPYTPAAFTPRRYPPYLFLLEAESTPVKPEGLSPNSSISHNAALVYRRIPTPADRILQSVSRCM